jgi:hypothetical protein
MSEEMNSIKPENDETTQFPLTITVPIDIKSLIYIIRNQQIMLDSDLAALYQVETKVLNQAVKRNISRFPEKFCFQLMSDEFEVLKSQFVTSSLDDEKASKHGGRRTMPYVFNEQGIAMLSAVLRSDIAIQVSIRIMEAFVEMRRFIVNNSLLFEHITNVELKLLEYAKRTDTKLDEIFEYINDHKEQNQRIFFDGQIYDAFSIISSLVQNASTSILLIDGYVNGDTLDLLSKKKQKVSVTVFTNANTQLTRTEIAAFNAQYPTLDIKYTKLFHDRFLILDNSLAYHIGASIKDAGKKCFAINLIEDTEIIKEIIKRL